jgi:hypothetical protein
MDTNAVTWWAVLLYIVAGHMRLLWVVGKADRDKVLTRWDRLRLVFVHWLLWPWSLLAKKSERWKI